jgi:hypothetical protein
MVSKNKHIKFGQNHESSFLHPFIIIINSCYCNNNNNNRFSISKHTNTPTHTHNFNSVYIKKEYWAAYISQISVGGGLRSGGSACSVNKKSYC